MAQLGTKKYQTANGIVEVPIYDVGDVDNSMRRVMTSSGVGAIPLVPPSDADYPFLRVQTSNGVLAMHGAATVYESPGGGGGPGDYDGPAGGDGSGTGSPAFESNITTTLFAQSDLGMDGSGNQPINSTLMSNIQSNTEIIFESGTYLIDLPSDGTGLIPDSVANFAMKGGGGVRDDVAFTCETGTAGRMMNWAHSSDNIWLANFVIDQSGDGEKAMSIAHTSDGYLYAYNIATRGRRPVDTETGPPADGAGVTSFIMSTDSSGLTHIENYECIDGPTRLVDYPNNTSPIFAGFGNKGDIELVNCRIEDAGEHAVYASRTPGAVRVDGGRYVNNVNTNMRIAGSGSYIRNAVIGITRTEESVRTSDGNSLKAIRGLRVEAENTDLGGKSGGYAENVDFVKTSSMDVASMLAEVHGSQGAFEFHNCRFRDESSDYSDTITVRAVGASSAVTPPTPHAVTVDGSAFTGGGDSAAVDSSRSSAPTVISNCCLGVAGGPGFTGAINESGTSYSGCTRASL